MPRDADALLLRKWAGGAGAQVSTPEALGLVRNTGFPESYGVDEAWTHGLFNQLLREITARLVEVEQQGILQWVAGQEYLHPAHVTGSDGNLYRSVRDSGGSNPSRDPTTDGNGIYWRVIELVVPESSTSRRGTIETATVAEARAGEDSERAVTPQGARAYINQAIAAAPRPLWL